MKHAPFLRWWLLATLVSVGCVFTCISGYFGLLWEKDSSYLSWLIFTVFGFFSMVCGINTFKVSKSAPKTKEEFEAFQRQEEVGWFASDLCLTLGMLGTIVGFVLMLSGFESIDMSMPQTIQGLLSELGKSMATALYTTLNGLVCGSLLKIQCLNFSLELQRLTGLKKEETSGKDGNKK